MLDLYLPKSYLTSTIPPYTISIYTNPIHSMDTVFLRRNTAPKKDLFFYHEYKMENNFVGHADYYQYLWSFYHPFHH